MASIKELYAGYIKKNKDQYDTLWKESLFTFDANVLLSLYRYSTDTRTEILKVIKELDKRFFLTYQAGLEFHRNRYSVISEQIKNHAESLSSIQKLLSDLIEKKTTPYLSSTLENKFRSVVKSIENEIKSNQEGYRNFLTENDPILQAIHELLDNSIDEPFSTEKLREIYAEGKKRYDNEIPPGFKDKNKLTDSKYGDLVIWKHIIRKSVESKKSIIFVTDDKKEDWWWKESGDLTIGPRPELIEEIFKEAGVSFHMYTTEQFLKRANEYLETKVDNSVLQEVKKESISDEHSSHLRNSYYEYIYGVGNKEVFKNFANIIIRPRNKQLGLHIDIAEIRSYLSNILSRNLPDTEINQTNLGTEILIRLRNELEFEILNSKLSSYGFEIISGNYVTSKD